MRTLTRRLLLPGMTTLALAATACSTAAPTGATGTASAPTAAAARTDDGARELDVNAVPQEPAAPTALARTRADGGRPEKAPLQVASYDRASGRAVISKAAPASPASRAPSASASSPGRSAAPDAPVAVGDVIASAPVPGAPDGLLAKVTEVVGKTGRGTEVKTASTTLAAALGNDTADGKVPVDPAAFRVEPLMKGVTVSWAKPGGVRSGPHGAQLPLGNLRLDVDAAVDTAEGAPASAGASVSGFVQLAPEVEFSYDGGPGAAPGGAFLGMSGDWSSQWELAGRAAASTGTPRRIPFARLHSDPVIQVGPVPVVVNLDLTCYVQVEADGRVTLDVRQDVKGGFRVGGGYAAGRGWTPVSTSTVRSTPVKAEVSAAGKVRAAVGAEASVGLYGAVGVTADFAPYLRGEADAGATASGDGKAAAAGSWAVHGGFDLSGRLRFGLSLFGTPAFAHDVPLGSLNREWPLARGRATS
ncbi:hypothetical protein ACGFXC_06270 [Streptomyces sp. NPDC048507]|uniref:hypothetical protein n=1 Tax=Streptomyces sp. NPDC048507 TaxID=3365560 RepID=UPI00371746F6